MKSSFVLKNATLADGSKVDIAVVGIRIFANQALSKVKLF